MDTFWANLTDLFGWVIQTSLYALVVIVVIVMVQMLGRRHLPVKWNYALWLILLVRLVLPSGLESGLSLWNFVPEFAFWESKFPSAGQADGSTLLYPGGADVSLAKTESGRVAPLTSNEALTEKNSDTAVRPIQKIEPGLGSVLQKAWNLAPGVWLAGALCLMIVIAISNLRLWKSVRKLRLVTDELLLNLFEDCKQQMGVRTVIGLALTDHIKSPTLFGFIRPRVLLPTTVTKQVGYEELRYIFLHELAHLKRGDIWMGWIVALLQSLHWFNPVVWWAFARMRLDRELACDAKVLSHLQGDESGRYGSALLHLLEHFSHTQSLPAIAGILENKAQLKRRIVMISHFRLPPRGMVILAAALLAILSVALLTDAKDNVIAGVAVSNQMQTPQSEPIRVSRFSDELPEDQQFIRGPFGDYSLAVSPDHSHFVYGTTEGLYIRSLDKLDARLIPGTDGISSFPFFSPDGQWVAYISSVEGDRLFEKDRLMKIAISGGVPVALCNVPAYLLGMWCTDDTIVYATANDGIMRVSADGGTPETLIEAEDGTTYVSPQMLPDGRSVLFASLQEGTLYVQSLESGERKELLEGSYPRYLPTGHIVYRLEDNLFAVPFDINLHEVTGGRVSLVKGVRNYDISNSGTLVYITQEATTAATSSDCTLVWVNRQGKEESLAAQLNAYLDPKISPDGTKVALTIATGWNQDIWIWDLVREIPTRLTFDEATDNNPIWTPDGQRIVFSSNRGGAVNVYWKAANGTGEVEQLGSLSGNAIIPSSWSDDGKTLLLEIRSGEDTGYDIVAMSMEGDHSRKPLLEEKYNEAHPQISPNGRWMAYFSEELGQSEVYVRPFPDVNSGKWQISSSGGQGPRWSPDGRQLFFRSNDAIMAVSVENDPTFRAGLPQELFKDTYFSAEPGHSWDIHPDGKRFLMIKESTGDDSTEGIAQPKINIVLNWFEELKERVPTD